jgi:hypothetical protein
MCTIEIGVLEAKMIRRAGEQCTRMVVDQYKAQSQLDEQRRHLLEDNKRQRASWQLAGSEREEEPNQIY